MGQLQGTEAQQVLGTPHLASSPRHCDLMVAPSTGHSVVVCLTARVSSRALYFNPISRTRSIEIADRDECRPIFSVAAGRLRSVSLARPIFYRRWRRTKAQANTCYRSFTNIENNTTVSIRVLNKVNFVLGHQAFENKRSGTI